MNSSFRKWFILFFKMYSPFHDLFLKIQNKVLGRKVSETCLDTSHGITRRHLIDSKLVLQHDNNLDHTTTIIKNYLQIQKVN